MRPRNKNILKQDRPGRVSVFLSAGYYSKIRKEFEGRLKCCFIVISSHLSHTSPGSGWSPHLRRATEHCKEEEEGFLPHPGPANYLGGEEVSEMAVRMS